MGTKNCPPKRSVLEPQARKLAIENWHLGVLTLALWHLVSGSTGVQSGFAELAECLQDFSQEIAYVSAIHEYLECVSTTGAFRMALSPVVLKPPLFFQSHSHLSLAEAHLLEFWPLSVWQSLAVVVLVSMTD